MATLQQLAGRLGGTGAPEQPALADIAAKGAQHRRRFRVLHTLGDGDKAKALAKPDHGGDDLAAFQVARIAPTKLASILILSNGSIFRWRRLE